MKYAIKTLSLILCFMMAVYGESTVFQQIRYNGGTLQTKVDPDDWGNYLAVSSDQIILTLKDGKILTIDPKKVSSLSYGQEAHRRVGTMVALGVLVAPVALIGLLHKTRKHFVGIEFKTEENKQSGVLLQAHKDNYRAVMMALKGVTGAKISVSEDDRKYLPIATDESTDSSSKQDAKKEK